MPLGRLSLTLVALATLIVTGTVTAADISQFRGAAGDGHAQAAGLPITWNQTDHVAWQVRSWSPTSCT